MLRHKWHTNKQGKLLVNQRVFDVSLNSLGVPAQIVHIKLIIIIIKENERKIKEHPIFVLRRCRTLGPAGGTHLGEMLDAADTSFLLKGVSIFGSGMIGRAERPARRKKRSTGQQIFIRRVN